MKRLVVVATTDDQDLITFTVIYRQRELLYGRLRWKWFGVNCGEKCDVVVNCYQRPAPGERWDNHGLDGYHEAILDSDEWNGNKREQLQDECIKKCIYRAVPDGKIVRIINI